MVCPLLQGYFPSMHTLWSPDLLSAFGRGRGKTACPSVLLMEQFFTAPLKSNAATFPSSGNSEGVLVTMPWVTY